MFDAIALDKILPEAMKIALWMWALALKMQAMAVAAMPWPLRILYYVGEATPMLIVLKRLLRWIPRF